MNKINFNLPLNSVSFGQTSTLLLRTLFDQDKIGMCPVEFTLFPIGPVDLSSQTGLTPEFKTWLESKIIAGLETHSRKVKTFKLWHLNSSIESLSEQQSLLTFYELDSPTKAEINTAHNNKIYFTSQYTCDIFKDFGIDAGYLPLAFDSYNFSVKNKQYFTDQRIVMGIVGKYELRKSHSKMISAWIKKYGNDPRYGLQCAIYNPFLSDQQNQQAIFQIVGNNKPFNVSFYPKMQENNVYNDFLNSLDIVLGMGSESWGIPEFQSVALGKHAVILNVNGYKSWATSENSVLIEPNGKIPAHDGMFFQKGGMFNQGSFFTYDDEVFISGIEQSIRRVEKDRINHSGLKLQEQFSKEKFVQNVITTLGS